MMKEETKRLDAGTDQKICVMRSLFIFCSLLRTCSERSGSFLGRAVGVFGVAE